MRMFNQEISENPRPKGLSHLKMIQIGLLLLLMILILAG